MSYSIKDENGERMRIVGRLEEAKYICYLNKGWTYKFFRPPSQESFFYNYKFEDALI
jgi:hypothetical protein